jgi:hypothetical protein
MDESDILMGFLQPTSYLAWRTIAAATGAFGVLTESIAAFVVGYRRANRTSNVHVIA